MIKRSPPCLFCRGSGWCIFLSSIIPTQLCIDVIASLSLSFSSVISHVIRLENSTPMQTDAKLMDEPQQLVMTALGAVFLLFVKHHIQAVRSIVRSRTLLEFFV
jgi:hypothetical protein